MPYLEADVCINPFIHLYRILHCFKIIKHKKTGTDFTFFKLFFKEFLSLKLFSFNLFRRKNKSPNKTWINPQM